MAGIMAPGVGSNLDINNIVSQLVNAEKAPAEKRIAKEEALVQARISSLGIVKSATSEFQSAIRSLSNLSTFQSKSVSVANENILSATVTGSAPTGRHSIEVTQLAQEQKLVSRRFNSATSIVGSGTLTFTFGSYDEESNAFTPNATNSVKEIEIKPGNNTLIGIRDAVNTAKIGVTATIINDGQGQRLVFSSAMGKANSMQISVSDSDGVDFDDEGLSQLAYDPTEELTYDPDDGDETRMTQSQAARDAILFIDGVRVSRPGNEISGVIAGVTLNLQNLNPGAPTTLSLRDNPTAIRDSVQKFVDSFNKLKSILTSVSKYNAEEKKAALLTGDATIRNMSNQLQRIVGQTITGLSGNLRALADIGITTARDGTLQLDSARLDRALSSQIEDFAALFAKTGRSSDSLVRYIGASSQTKPGEYEVYVERVARQGVYQGDWQALPSTMTISPGSSFTIRVNGVQSNPITLQAGAYTREEFANLLQTAINADSRLQAANRNVTVGFETDEETGESRFVLTSNRYGSDSTVELLNSSLGALGLSNRKGIAGQDVAGTIGGLPATGKGTLLTGQGDAQGLVIEIEGGLEASSRGTVSYSKGYGEQLNEMLNNFLSSNGLISRKDAEFKQRISSFGEQREKLKLKLENLEKRLRAQFTTLDLVVGKMRATSDSLTQQLQSLPNVSSK